MVKYRTRKFLVGLFILFFIGFFSVLIYQSLSTNPSISGNSRAVNPSDNKYSYNDEAVIGEQNVSIGGGGYITGVYLHPEVQDLTYVKTDVGGFYRWDLNQKQWKPLVEHFPLENSDYFGGEGLALDPQNPNVVFIAAGKYTWGEPGSLFKSTDRGETWKKLPLELQMGGNHSRKWLGERLVVSPHDSELVLFGSRLDGLWRSTNGGDSWYAVQSFKAQPRENVGITGIVFDPQDRNSIYANAYEDGIYKSNDAGESWEKLLNSPREVYRMAVSSEGTLYLTGKFPGILRYTNDQWETLYPGKYDLVFGGLSVNPFNSQEIIVATNRTSETRFFLSSDSGQSWIEKRSTIAQQVSWWPDKFFANHLAGLEFDPVVDGRVWFTDWYGVWHTDDIKQTPIQWTNEVTGIEEIVTFDLVSPPEGALLVSAVADVEGFYHDQGLESYPSKRLELGISGHSFQDTFDIDYCSRRPLELVRVGGNAWNSYYGGAISSDGGKSWDEFASFPEGAEASRVAISASDPNRIVVTLSNEKPIYTEDKGVSWQQASGLPDGLPGRWSWSKPLASDANDGQVFYYYDEGKFYRSTDGGKNFQITSVGLPTEDWFFVKAKPHTTKDVWVSLDDDGLYHSINGGDSFSKINSVERAYLFAFGRSDKDERSSILYLYGIVAGLGDGIFRSYDDGLTWSSMGNQNFPIGNEPNAMEASQQVPNLVFVGTNGRGIYYGSF